jgi:acyl carrier protein phosphodiesterase
LNYLAHAYLSFGHPEVLAGNMFSDFVKGKKKFEYPSAIQKGIALHRFIDSYTDTHEATRRAKEIFRPAYRLYSGAIIDVLYDHFLAIDSRVFTPGTLPVFSQATYAALDAYTPLMPERFATIFPYMKQQDWLAGYQDRQGIRHSLYGLVRRARYLADSETAFALFENHFQLLQDCYRQFWADAMPVIYAEFQLLTNDEKTTNGYAASP